MKISIKPTSLMLVGILLICIFLMPGSAQQQFSSLEQLNKLREHPSQKSPDLGKLRVGADIINFPWSDRENQPERLDPSGPISTSLKREEILMNSSDTTANVRELSAINSLKQRDLFYKDFQNGNPDYQGLLNSQDISVSGKGNDNSADKVAKMEWQEDSIGGEKPDLAGNYLNIDIHDISVSAINTMQGGSSVATSNIIIEPVQIIVCPSEIDVKLE